MTDRHLWLDPTFGVSGDMLLGALVGLGAPLDHIVDQLRRLEDSSADLLGLPGWSLRHSTVTRCSLTADRVEVNHDESEHHHRAWSTIDQALADSPLAADVVAGARATFRRLAEVEAGIHGIAVDQVHFHEVGAVDAVIDIVGTWVALDRLAVSGVSAGPVGVGAGTVKAAHGRLPIPAPATAALLVGAPIAGPDRWAESSARSDNTPGPDVGETATPTGVALLVTMVDHWGPVPSGRLIGVGRGAGGRDPGDRPNVLTGYLVDTDRPGTTGRLPTPGDDSTSASLGHPAQEEHREATDETSDVASVMIQTNLDDVSGEVVGHVIARCLTAGADDAWARPIIMKKGRPGVELQVLCRPERLDQLRHIVLTETGSLGCRTLKLTKHELARRFETVELDGHSISIKIGPHGAKPEFNDTAAAAEALGLPLRVVSERALQQFRQSNDPHD